MSGSASRSSGAGTGIGGGAGASKGNNNAGSNGSKANSGNTGKVTASKGASAGAGPSSSKGNSKANTPNAVTAPGGKSQRTNSKVQASSGKAPISRSKAPASAPQTPNQAKAAAPMQTAQKAASVKAQPARVAPVVEEIDRRPKPRQSSRSIVASGLSQADLAQLIAQGFRIETQTQGSIEPQVIRLRVPAGVSVAQARQRVRLVYAQASVDFDQFYYLDESIPACTSAECQSTPLVNWASLVKWSGSNTKQCGPAPLIGMIDTGINVEHDALRGQAIEVVAQSTRRAMPSLPDHGTAVAALLVGRLDSQTPGLLPEAKIIAVDAFYRDGGTADRTDVTSLVTALEALAERGVRVINLSLSGPANEVLQKAITAAQAKGIVIVAAAGNNGAGAEPSYPAAYVGVVAVTAVDHDLNVYRRATRGPYVDLSAPGVNVWTASAQGSGTLRTGTSYAVPFVSAAAGLVLASNPVLDAKAVQSRLEEYTRDLGTPGRDPTFGFGLIQMDGLCERPADSPAIATFHDQPAAAPLKGPSADMP
ncbi:S8 family serine peptidase [Microvirga arsenatis]|uniref:S8 family serine peptidase n=1 Tax=Microvirga arsenatis TaxID=2692265 RepID=A0ABW9Z550_9HYPH|nr:S8 family serine peptidase [Microvirga arsenatis]NBJ13599.1 S8 family serine peptidase [Microvirga arsenatis]NBJ27071.1 S8 family serine peptidase [Microvirga arsenatis]